MEMEIIIKIAAVGLIVAVLCQVLARSGRDDYALITALAGIVVVLLMLVPYFETLLSTLESVFGI